MIAAALKCNGLSDPVGIGQQPLRLSWQCEDGKRQSAWQIRIFSGGILRWDSGKRPGSDMFCLCPQSFDSRGRLRWQVRLWDENNVCGAWSEEARVETGLLHAEDWRALWIEPELHSDPKQRQSASYLRRRFTLASVKDARLYITAHGIYTARLNGRRVGELLLTPGSSNYDKRLEVQTYDVTELLWEGENELLVTLGDGWYRGGNGNSGETNVYGTALALLCQLEVSGEPRLVSDGDWIATQCGPVRENDLQQGERVDARLEFSCWHPVRIADFGYANIVCSDSAPVKAQEAFSGVLLHTPDGETVFDFGQNMAGITELFVRASGGEKIILEHGEALDENGCFTRSNFQPGANHRAGQVAQRIEYICRPGENRYRPEFCIFGFRYVRVTGDIPAERLALTAHAVYSDMPQTGFFTCSDERVNRLVNNCLWSQKSNFCYVPTDCPTRERSAFTGDAQIYAQTALYLADCAPVLRKWLAECRSEQTEDGRVPSIAPHNSTGDPVQKFFSGSVGWGDAAVIVPYTLWQMTGDDTVLRENLDMMRGWVDYLLRRARLPHPGRLFKHNPYRRYTVEAGIDWGEWLEPDTDETETLKNNIFKGTPEIGTAFLSYSARLLSEACEALRYDAQAQYYGMVAEKARQAFYAVCTQNGRICSGRQHHYVRPLAFGLLDGDDAHRAAADLNGLVIQNGWHLNTGFLSTGSLCRVLANYGYVDTAYRLLLQNSYPGWLYEVEKGATTIWENWDGISEDGKVKASLNHYSYGAVVSWLFSGVCGIRWENGALNIRPQPDPQLRFARCEYRSSYGTVRSGWEYRGEQLLFSVSVPANGQARLVLPDGSERELDAGDYEFTVEVGK